NKSSSVYAHPLIQFCRSRVCPFARKKRKREEKGIQRSKLTRAVNGLADSLRGRRGDLYPCKRAMDSLLGLLRIRVIRGLTLPSRRPRQRSLHRHPLGSPEVRLRRYGDVSERAIIVVWGIGLGGTNQERVLLDLNERYDHNYGNPLIKFMTRIPSVVMIRWENCLVGESPIQWKDGKVIQDLVLRLRNVESGEVELQLLWVSIPGLPGF
ncbi:hypothetical protein HPP92_012055, partial [Vanilla planifolia]